MSDKWGDIARTLGCEVTEEADALRKEVERLREALDAACLRAGHHQTISESRQEEVERLRALGVQVIHDERESAVAMVHLAMSSYQRKDIDPEEVVGEAMEIR
jgi:2-keto-3-deoxy-L-rhamnonate aldolase RhmA